MDTILRGGRLCAVFLGLTLGQVALAGSWQQNAAIGGFNSVNIYTPDSQSAIGHGRALLIVLHGCVQPISNYLTANLEDAAEAHGMVIAVPDAVNKAGFSCWSYWQGSISRNSGDYANLIGLANALTSDTSLNIDTDQVYISGLSSGAAFAAQAACVAPDVFAGVAPSAGPTIGTSSGGAIGTCEVVSPSAFRSRCRGYAGSYVSFLDTQIAVVGHGTADTTVDTCYNQQNANGYAAVYGATQIGGTSTVSEGVGHTAQQTLWTDRRVSMLWFDGLDHSWSGGAGASGSYVAPDSINFATYLGTHFSENNLRVDRNSGPIISGHQAVDSGGYLSVSGTAQDAESSVASVQVDFRDASTGTTVDTQSANVTSQGDYTATSVALVDGLYEVIAIASDDEGKAGDAVSVTTRVGPEPPPQAPVLSNVSTAIDGQCATVSGNVVDANQDLDVVEVEFATGTVAATVTGTAFSASRCDLPGGTNLATVLAVDAEGLSVTQSVSFEVDAGVTGDYNLHIQQGHITWGNGYSACYLAHGTAPFTMREYPQGNGQCRWIDDEDSACAGPLQACASDPGGPGNDADGDGIDDSMDNCPQDANPDQNDNDGDGLGNVCDPTPDGDPTGSCTETTSSNYAHVSAGRATTSGWYVFAVGSGDSMGLYNIWVTTTLAETSPGFYELGQCP